MNTDMQKPGGESQCQSDQQNEHPAHCPALGWIGESGLGQKERIEEKIPAQRNDACLAHRRADFTRGDHSQPEQNDEI